MEDDLLIILISGSSHVGKTTFATRLAEELGWESISTDSLARHPGRPWLGVSPHVKEYYSRLSDEAIYWFLLAHHENMWPMMRQRICAAQSAQAPLIFEGSALRPEYLGEILSREIRSFLLYADNNVLQERIRAEAGYHVADAASRHVIDRFIERSLRDNLEMHAAALKHGVQIADAADNAAMVGLFDEMVSWAAKLVSTR
ncbi:AAA family ATPase [Peteryoungia desertarenae]|uniref:AAA family ATPase n=1 Tax=Peteryoungia desertarenae TaxID=1813451 RepID=A0ABX6QRI5_9HYPH|nr:AAA family ATPase [Peteryoungia desertarenae]